MEQFVSKLWIVFVLITLHLIGDYVLQGEYIAKTKGENWYHLFVHSILYALPFWLLFHFTWPILAIAFTHFVVDAAKARYHKISYQTDQVIHYFVLFFVYNLSKMVG